MITANVIAEIDKVIKDVWLQEICNDYANGFLLKEASLQCSFYHHLQNRLGGLMKENNLYLYPEFYFDQLYYFADLAIVQMDMGIEAEYIGKRMTDVAAVIELKYDGGTAKSTGDYIKTDVAKLKNYIKNMEIPVIFLTARDSEEDIVNALDMGASDYLTKPFRTGELIARINKILNKKTISVKNITYDLNKMSVYKDNKIINLTTLELKILGLLFTNINKVVTRDKIIDSIWEWTGNDVNDNTVTVYMKRIREKLDSDIIITLKGMGYRIDEK